jgi:glycerol-3-phosphate dehydrogenase
VPLYRQTRRRAWQLGLGLSLYALLSGFRAGAGFGQLPRRQWDQLDGLKTRDLQHVFYYHDAQTDDRALTAAVMHSAQSLGAELICPARCLGATLHEQGVRIQYSRATTPADASSIEECQARVLVNAAGPWAEELARSIQPAIAVPAVQRVQGSHLVLPVRLERGCYYLESPRDGRAIFALPWHGQLLLGTTEIRHRGPTNEVSPSNAEANYLLDVLRHYFPNWRGLGPADVRASFAGLRVLPSGTGHAFHRSRETLLVVDRNPARVLSIYGGKLTTWRAVSQRTLLQLSASLPARQRRARTDQLPLTPVATDA